MFHCHIFGYMSEMPGTLFWQVPDTLQKETFQSQARGQEPNSKSWPPLWWSRLWLCKPKNNADRPSGKWKPLSTGWYWIILATPTQVLYLKWVQCSMQEKGCLNIFGIPSARFLKHPLCAMYGNLSQLPSHLGTEVISSICHI